MPRAATRDAATRRKSLLEAATAVVREDGPRATMEAMAAAGGVTKPILYRHFGDRRGLVAAIGERFQQELGAAISAALATYGRAGDGSVLRATIDAYLSLVERETELYRFLVQQDARSGNEISSAFVAQVSVQVAELVGGALHASGRDTTPAELWAVGIVGMVHAAGDWWAQECPELDRTAVVDGLTELLWGGLGALGRPVTSQP